MLKRLLVAGAVLLACLYPFISAWLVAHAWGRWILAAVATTAAIKASRTKAAEQRLIYAALAAAVAVGAALNEGLAVRLIPAFVYLSLTSLFGYTLSHPPSLLERLVRLQFPEFKPGIAEYLRQVTWLWTGFFAASAIVCAVLAALPDSRPWLMYTGTIVYVLMAALVLGEMWYRPRRFPDLEIPPPLTSLKVMLRDGHKVFRDLQG